MYLLISYRCYSSHVQSHILKHVESHKIFTVPEHGFISSQLITTAHDLLLYFDNGRQVYVNVLDFSKAFDTVVVNG